MQTESTTYTIGQIAAAAGIHRESVRYYERMGLMPKPRRSAAGYRLYTERDRRRLLFIKRAQALGFSLQEIGELLFLREQERITCRDMVDSVQAKVTEVEAKMRMLERLNTTLRELLSRCDGEGRASSCPILGTLEQDCIPHATGSETTQPLNPRAVEQVAADSLFKTQGDSQTHDANHT